MINNMIINNIGKHMQSFNRHFRNGFGAPELSRALPVYRCRTGGSHRPTGSDEKLETTTKLMLIISILEMSRCDAQSMCIHK